MKFTKGIDLREGQWVWLCDRLYRVTVEAPAGGCAVASDGKGESLKIHCQNVIWACDDGSQQQKALTRLAGEIKTGKRMMAEALAANPVDYDRRRQGSVNVIYARQMAKRLIEQNRKAAA